MYWIENKNRLPDSGPDDGIRKPNELLGLGVKSLQPFSVIGTNDNYSQYVRD